MASLGKSSLLLFLGILVVWPNGSHHLKVKDRFKGYYGQLNLTYGGPTDKMIVPEDYGDLITGFEQLKEILVGGMKRTRVARINYVPTDGHYYDGEPDENGTYNGLIGMIQSHKIDSGYFAIDPATLTGEPVHIGSVFTSTALMIMSREKKGKFADLQISDWFEMFDGLTYAYISIVLLIVSIMLNLIASNEELQAILLNKKPFCLLRKVSKTYLEIFTMIMGQNGMDHQWFAGQIIVGFISLFHFFLIISIFMNLLSTDQFTERRANIIDSIYDLLSDEFRSVTPIIFGGLWFDGILKKASKESEMGKLWQRINEDYKASVIDVKKFQEGKESMDKMLKIVDDVARGRAAFIVTRTD